jgi:integrase
MTPPTFRKDFSMKLTQHSIGTVMVPPGKAEIIVWDDDVPGFGLRTYSGGSAAWIFQFRIGTKQRRMKLGSAKAITAQDARKTAARLHAQTMLGRDPAGEKIEARSRIVETFGAILKPYLTRKQGETKPRAYTEIERHLLKHAKPVHTAELGKIERRTVATLLTALATNSGPHVANSVRSSFSSFFGWAMREGLAESNPMIGTNKAVTEGSRDRVLANDELRLIWNALDDSAYSDILRLLTLTAARRNEIGDLRWSEVNLGQAVISLPAERTKNSRPFDIHLSPMALAILRDRPRRAGSECVFTAGANGFRGWSKLKIELDARIGAIAPWRLHDLRRTVSTRMHDELGIAPHIVEAVLNHVSGHRSGVAGVYNRATYSKEKAIALARWAERLGAIVSGEPSVVVPMRR